MKDLEQGILQGKERAIAQAITLVENQEEKAVSLLQSLKKKSKLAYLVGITGPPGSGKSTLSARLIQGWREKGIKVGVIAIDPSSSFSGGALLGDRIRMEQVVTDPGVFIRSMATRGALGGLNPAIFATVLILSAAGYKYILIETVGVGQNEIDIARLANTTLLLTIPEAGDEIQAYKAGLMEIGDIFIINKADRPGVRKMELILRQLLGWTGRKESWQPPVLQTIATRGQGITEVLKAIECHRRYLLEEKLFLQQEKNFWAEYFRYLLEASIKKELVFPLLESKDIQSRIREIRDWEPYSLVGEIIDRLKGRRMGFRGMKIDHLGIAVENIEEALVFYEKILGLKKAGEEVVPEQGVKVAFFQVGESRLELLEPLNEDSPVARHLQKRGQGIHHLALQLDGLEEKVAEMKEAGAQFIGKISTGAEGKKIIFLHPRSTEGILLELCEER